MLIFWDKHVWSVICLSLHVHMDVEKDTQCVYVNSIYIHTLNMLFLYTLTNIVDTLHHHPTLVNMRYLQLYVSLYVNIFMSHKLFFSETLGHCYCSGNWFSILNILQRLWRCIRARIYRHSIFKLMKIYGYLLKFTWFILNGSHVRSWTSQYVAEVGFNKSTFPLSSIHLSILITWNCIEQDRRTSLSTRFKDF